MYIFNSMSFSREQKKVHKIKQQYRSDRETAKPLMFSLGTDEFKRTKQQSITRRVENGLDQVYIILRVETLEPIFCIYCACTGFRIHQSQRDRSWPIANLSSPGLASCRVTNCPRQNGLANLYASASPPPPSQHTM